MSKKIRITKKDIAAFYEAVKGTTILVQKKIRLKTPSFTETRKRKATPPPESFNLEESKIYPSVTGEEFISFKQTSFSYKTLRKLRKGQYNVEAKLDLHGMTIEKAKTTLEVFFLQCLSEKLKVVLIVHGKGHHGQGPILKNKLNQWLRHLPFVLAFCSATMLHGSRGALYVFLKIDQGEKFA